MTRLTCRLASSFLGLIGLLGAATTVSAQELPGFLLHRFTPSTPGSDWFALDSLDFRGQARPALRLAFDWSQNPFVFEDVNGDDAGEIVARQVLLHLGLSLNIASRLRLGVDMPFAVHQKGNGGQLGTITYPDPEGAAPGDLRASADLLIVGEYGEPFSLALGGQVFFPTGKESKYLGDGLVRFMPRLQAAGDLGGAFAYALSFGFMTRDAIEDGYFQGYGIGHEFFGGAAFGIRPTSSVLIGAEIAAYTKADSDDFLKRRSTPLELLFGARFLLADQIRFAVGAGPGITPSKGSPAVRFLAKLEWAPPAAPPDSDSDGVLDDVDACRDTPGVRTDDPATTGCPPPPDRDRDGIIDSQDACPDETGIRSSDPAKNGCQPPRDRDGDGVVDPQDACPDERGIATEDPAKNGCPPPPDQDKDGVIDSEDACPAKAGDKTDDPKTSGCPDSDGDGLRDSEDACPDQAGARDPDPKKNGCPLARVEQGQVKIIEQVKFKSSSATILAESNPVLEAVAKILKEHPEIKQVRVEGHTDNRGGKSMNQRLSERRAAAVAKWLVTKGGIEKSRLVSEGLGMDRPIADNATEDGRKDNRRVEFHIVDPAPAAPATP